LKKVRRVAVITGTRAEYGLLVPVMRAVAARRGLQLQLVVTGMHVCRRLGMTINQIRKDGWRIDARVPMQRGDDHPLDQAHGLARGIRGISDYLHGANSDIVVVLGDRIEALAGALAAVTTGRILAHIHGGDVAAGDFDDSARHAITKLAHVHLAASSAAAARIIQMGEQSNRVFVVGAPGLDDLHDLLASSPPVAKSGRRALIVHHPIGRSAAAESTVMTRILKTVAAEKLEGTIILPNSDRGHSGIREAIERHVRRRTPRGENRQQAHTWNVVPSLPRAEYLQQLIAADVLIGNSSSGMIESSVAGTPVVNIGDRQRGRDHDAAMVLHSDESESAIRNSIRRALSMGRLATRHSIDESQPAGPKIARILGDIPLTEAFRRKVLQFTAPAKWSGSNERADRGR